MRSSRWGLALFGLLVGPTVSELRLRRAAQRPTSRWRTRRIEPRGETGLGFSFRPRQAQALGLDPRSTLTSLLSHPFSLVRLPVLWADVEPSRGLFDFSFVDWQVEAAEQAGKQIILGLGALKNFGYPEFFAPHHRLPDGLPERTRIRPADYPGLLGAARDLLARLVERYAEHHSIVAWQIEHEAVDPLGLEHSWRLDRAFVAAEVDTVRRADPSRPVLLNGYLPVSLAVLLTQWWQTRDQGDSLAAAAELADLVGLDYYPRHALLNLPGTDLSLYLDGSTRPWHRRQQQALLRQVQARGKRVLVSEGQAEPWEAVTTPPNRPGQTMYSCGPEQLIDHYNHWLRLARQERVPLLAYLFWGAEYWLARERGGDSSYLDAALRILRRS